MGLLDWQFMGNYFKKMNLINLTKTKLSLVALAIGVIGILILLIFSLKQARGNWKIIKTVPAEQAFHNPNQPIEITFNQSVQLKNISLMIEPKTEYQLLPGPNLNTVLVQPKGSFQAETNYTLTLKTPANQVLKFKTEIQAGNSPGWNEEFDQLMEQEIAANKPQYDGLRNIRRSAPILEIGFTVNYRSKDNTYVVSLAAPFETNKAKALDWFNQQGVTDFKYVRLEWKQ